ncbi:sigma-70 family RNA polymerase sigma factor [Janthinobacterium agaricidamnosum]|uniref:RNA polymerase sigma factor, sigma-70 family protein n=1 Tax=Janthinobacterium agaricidamnosum NBRC 102515 = DSM 9628 TaxID=1349767 RepID=W0VC28_9BURK|nr:sigma-70 family RNA polymerase sigma factor [Janthinobacterium agaricidamnosum]CDG84862.1 RNA polymerase sigma factor, sigma-70 family protein [Janthinobacterium agaricidamnosum NBRC 102515 = DSM 9628]
MISTSVPSILPLNRFLKMAVMAGIESAIQIHIDRGDDLNARDGNGLTLLMLSAGRNKFSMCKFLLDAGVDKDLLDPSGKTAYAIAVAAGAHEAVAILEAAVTLQLGVFGAQGLSMIDPPDEHIMPLESQALECTTSLAAVDVTQTDTVPHNFHFDAKELSELESVSEFDLIGWEPEEDASPPEVDPSVAQAASAIQVSISKYEPIDSSEDWEDIDVYLPERSLPLARTSDAEARELLRLLLLRAAREGSVPSAAVKALSLNDDQSANPEAEALLTMVINDVGAEVDERFEYAKPDENFEVYVNPEETPDEEEIVTNAFAFIDNLASRYSEPLRIYQKEFQRERLISAEEEVFLGKAMEVQMERALDALAAWPRGIDLTLAAGNIIKTKQRPLIWLSLGPIEAEPNLESTSEGESDADIAATDQAEEELEADEESQFDSDLPLGSFTSEFSDAMDRLASLPVGPTQRGANWAAIRETLSSLRLNRRFLLELANAETDGAQESAMQYASAIKGYQIARERMVAANLKLVFHLAKKHLYSGEPLDDLAQEGNIGLLKAVERYDWRRGFKFSTYATWWIRQHIGRYIADKCRTIRVPVHVYGSVQRLARETREFESENGHSPELNEIAARLDMPAYKVSALQRLAPEPISIHDLSIDELIAADALSDFVSPDPFDIAFKSDVHKTIDRVLATLKPKEAQIIRLRYGIGINDSLTLDDIGQRYEVTRERIRQIEAKAIQKLMQPSRIDALSNVFFGYPFSKESKGQENSSLSSRSKPSADVNSIQSQLAARPTPDGTSSPVKTSSIDKFLTQAMALGVSVIDERKEASGKIWISFIETPDGRYKKLARKLLALGFEFIPEKGYWK